MDAKEAIKCEAQEDLGTELVLLTCWYIIIQSNEKAETTEMSLTEGKALKSYDTEMLCGDLKWLYKNVIQTLSTNPCQIYGQLVLFLFQFFMKTFLSNIC